MVNTRASAARESISPMKQRDGSFAYAPSPLGKAPSKTPQNGKQSWADSHGTGEQEGAWGLKGPAGWAFSYAGALLLMLLCPAFAIFMWYALTHLDGSLAQTGKFFVGGGVSALYHVWPRPSGEALAYVAGFGLIQAALQLLLPGKPYKGPVTPKGNVPLYKANGVLSYVVTLALFFGGAYSGVIKPSRVYDLFGEILAALNVFSLAFCAFLYVKGKYAPSSSDSGTTGSLLYDFYWGMELYPRIGKSFDLKTWTNCRMGLMGWGVIILCFAAKQREAQGRLTNSLAIAVLLMHLYIFKFFLWETGYWSSMDIMHDRAGYYICWGCLVWVPAIYTSPALYLAGHPRDLSWPLGALITIAGAASVYINWDSDRQRQVFRATEGKAKVWGKAPKKIQASYTTSDGATKSSLLLASGWWGLARHFHYLPEILASFFWTVPAGFPACLPYFYVFYLTLLLTDRSFRDERRCASKYGRYWDSYKKLVPYRMVPFIF